MVCGHNFSELPSNQSPFTSQQWQQWTDDNAPYRDIIPLRLSGASYAEISQQTGISEQSVRSLIDSLLGSCGYPSVDSP